MVTFNKIPKKLAPKVPKNITRNPPCCSFASFATIPLKPLINIPESSRDVMIFIISSITSFESINVVVPILYFCFKYLHLLLIPSQSTALAGGARTVFANGKPVFDNAEELCQEFDLICHLLVSVFLVILH